MSARDIIFPATPEGYIEAGNGETIICFVPKHITKANLRYAPEIFLSEREPEVRGPLLPYLGLFAGTTKKIIDLFDR